MNTVSRTITGVVLAAIGLGVLLASVRHGVDSWGGAVWGLVWVGFGVYIFFNTKEDAIEEITTDDNKK